jgi:hypothetical protein
VATITFDVPEGALSLGANATMPPAGVAIVHAKDALDQWPEAASSASTPELDHASL